MFFSSNSSYPANFMFLISLLKKTKQNKRTLETHKNTHAKPQKLKSKYTSRKPIRQKNFQKRKMRQKVYKISPEFVLCWPTTPGHEAYPEVWSVDPVRLHWRELSLLLVTGATLLRQAH